MNKITLRLVYSWIVYKHFLYIAESAPTSKCNTEHMLIYLASELILSLIKNI